MVLLKYEGPHEERDSQVKIADQRKTLKKPYNTKVYVYINDEWKSNKSLFLIGVSKRLPDTHWKKSIAARTLTL